MRLMLALLVCVRLFASPQQAADDASGDPKERAKAVREYAKQAGPELIPKLVPYLHDTDTGVRIEAVKAIISIGGRTTLEPLIAATKDPDPEVQIRATDGIVNFYVPGYAKEGGLSASLRRVGSAIKAKFDEQNAIVIDPFLHILPEIPPALGALVRGASSMESRANAARALGVLRGKDAIEDLYDALRSKNTNLMYESIMALQKIRDPEAGPRIRFLLRDLDEKVQLAAVETTGLLQNLRSAPDLRDVLEHDPSKNVRRAALTSLAMLPVEDNRSDYARYFRDRDDAMRAAAAEGYARLKNPADRPMLEKAFADERKQNPRLSIAFALVNVGDHDFTEFSPLRYLVNTLNTKAWRGVARAFLTELCRAVEIRQTVYAVMNSGTKDERTQLAQVLAVTGDRDTLQYLQPLASDPDPDVAAEGLKALRTLKARL
ncbi:MAG: HEAT repeat domain-containing protein [Bryobacteraceae bacterium]